MDAPGQGLSGSQGERYPGVLCTLSTNFCKCKTVLKEKKILIHTDSNPMLFEVSPLRKPSLENDT